MADPVACPTCSAENAPTRKFCRACGAGLAPVCAACGSTNEVGDRYCGECGAPLVAAAHTAPGAVPSAAALAQRGGDPLGSEERRTVTVLFADIVGFTSLSERWDVEDVREVTTECFRRLVAEITRYDGTIDKFMGDAVMALFGAPIAHEDDPRRAILAALGMQAALQRFNEELSRTHGTRLALRIGAETGEVVAGTRDVQGVREYTVIGDAVNVAARLQAATDPDTILIGERLRGLTEREFELAPVGTMMLKGRAGGVAAARVLGERAEHGAVAIAARTPLVGREVEIAALAGCIAALREGRGRVVTLVGEPGLGKSRLLTEAARLAGATRTVQVVSYAHEQSASYGVARSLTRATMHLIAGHQQAGSWGQFRQWLGEHALDDRADLLARFLGDSDRDASAIDTAGLSPQELHEQTFTAVTDLVRHLAEQAPLIVQVDDLHWADPTSVDLLRKVAGMVSSVPLLLVLAMRPEADTLAWALRDSLAREQPDTHLDLRLAPLSERESSALVEALIGGQGADSGLRTVIERAAGTPLWLEELTRTLIERGALVHRDGVWELAGDAERMDLPTSLQSLIVARIDRLGEARVTVQAASVIGRRFARTVLDRVGEAGPRLGDHLDRAERADLLHRLNEAGSAQYDFKHVLTQEAAYTTLLARRRRQLHRQVAEALQELHPERTPELHALLAHHCERAEMWQEAAWHATKGAEQARAAYANAEAVDLYTRAIRNAQRAGLPGAELSALHGARAEIHAVLGSFEASRTDYETAITQLQGVPDPAAEARLVGALGMLWGGHKDYQRGLELTTRSAELAERVGDRRLLAEARVRVGLMGLNLAHADEAEEEFERALHHFQALDDHLAQVRTRDILGMTMFVSGQLRRAEDTARGVVPALEALGDAETLANTWVLLGAAIGYCGRMDEGIATVQRGVDDWRRMGSPSGVAFALMLVSEINEPFGRYESALRAGAEALQTAREIGHREWTAGSLAAYGRTLALCGRMAEARALHTEMLTVARELGTRLWEAEALQDLGTDALAMGEHDHAEDLFEQALEMAPRALKAICRALVGRAQAALARGDAGEAISRARYYHERAPDFSVFRLEANRVEGEALLLAGEREAGLHLLEATCAGALDLDARPVAWRAGLALAEAYRRSGESARAEIERFRACRLIEDCAAELVEHATRDAFLRANRTDANDRR
ncbi:MAG: adenylate/guanylate cyclase domain-containing protein [Chloroflexota bacterium]